MNSLMHLQLWTIVNECYSTQVLQIEVQKIFTQQACSCECQQQNKTSICGNLRSLSSTVNADGDVFESRVAFSNKDSTEAQTSYGL